MDKTISLGLVIGAALGKSYFSTFNSAEQKATKLGSALKNNLGQQAAIEKFARLKKSVASTESEMKAAQLRVAALAREIKGADKPSKKLIADFDQAKRSAARLKEQHARQGEQLHRLRGELRGAGIDTRNLSTHNIKLGKSIDDTRRKIERLTKAQQGQQAAADKLVAMRGKMLGAVGAIYGASRMFGQSMDREEEGAYLKTVINARDGDRQAAIGRALAHARKFSRGTLASDSEMLQIEYQLNSAGLSEDVARAGSEMTHMLAKITKGSSDQVGEIVGITFNNMGDSLTGSAEEKMNQIGNILAKTQFKYQIRDFGQLGESLKYAGESAASAKVPLADTAAVIGILNSSGLQGSMAGTAFSATMRNMTKASEELGFEVVRSSDGMLDMVATLEGLDSAIADLELDERNDILQQLFGEEGKRGIGNLLQKLPELKDGISELTMLADGRLVSDTYADFLKGSRAQWTMFIQNMSQIGEVFSGTLLPALNAVLSPIGAFAGSVAELLEASPVISWMIGAVAGGFAIYAASIGIATAAQWAWNTALLANPLGLTIAAIVAGAALIYANWEPLMDWFSEKLDWLSDKFSWVGDAWNAVFGDDKPSSPDAGKGKRASAVTAAAAATVMAATPATAAPAQVTHQSSNSYSIAIQSHPGQNGADLVDEMARAIAKRNAARARAAMQDGSDL